jgi:hypothetical protein
MVRTQSLTAKQAGCSAISVRQPQHKRCGRQLKQLLAAGSSHSLGSAQQLYLACLCYSFSCASSAGVRTACVRQTAPSSMCSQNFIPLHILRVPVLRYLLILDGQCFDASMACAVLHVGRRHAGISLRIGSRPGCYFASSCQGVKPTSEVLLQVTVTRFCCPGHRDVTFSRREHRPFFEPMTGSLGNHLIHRQPTTGFGQ